MSRQRGSEKHLLATRMAAEGIPVGAIARVLNMVEADVEAILDRSIKLRALRTMPPLDWPDAERTREPPAIQVDATLEALARDIHLLIGYRMAEARFCAALLLHGFIDRPTIRGIACKQGGSTKALDTLACSVRKKLAALEVEFVSIHGIGYDMTAPYRARLRDEIGALAAARDRRLAHASAT